MPSTKHKSCPTSEKLEAEMEQPELEHTYWAETWMIHEIHHFLGVK